MIDEFPEDPRHRRWLSSDSTLSWDQYRAKAFEPLESLSGSESAIFKDIHPSQAPELQQLGTGGSRPAIIQEMLWTLEALQQDVHTVITFLGDTCGSWEVDWLNADSMFSALTGAKRASKAEVYATFLAAYDRAQA